MLTPRTPRPWKITVTIILTVAALIPGKAQRTTIKPLTDYETSLKEFYNTRLQADRTEYATQNNKKWWYYLPGVGYAFGGPTVSVSTDILARIDQDRQTKRAKLDAITAQTIVAYREELHELRSRYRIIELQEEEMNEHFVISKLENNILNIAEDANTAKTITPENYARALLAYQTQHAGHKAKYRQYQERIIELERLARYNYPTETLSVQLVQNQLPAAKR